MRMQTDENDLDELLRKATANLLKKKQEAEKAAARADDDDDDDGEGADDEERKTKKKNPRKQALRFEDPSPRSFLNRVRIDPGLPDEENDKGDEVRYMHIKEDRDGSVRLNKADEIKSDTVVLKKSKEVIPPTLDYDEKTKKKMAKEKETTGPGWFDMKAPELTEELKRDIDVIKSRSALDPKRFYKKPDKNMKGSAYPKFFQIGSVVDHATDYYANRLTKKERKRGILEELMADRETKSYLKKKFTKIQKEKADAVKPYRKPLSAMRGKSKKVAASTVAKRKMRL
ncbi:Deoxynucleotidyltransferase terminal-interacting protein 2 [Phlyctochytrium bullatum]|nr:Deoxynucleotidyltransferase terminal-interacting protein 2 [Phlyctochytrium bullatum]